MINTLQIAELYTKLTNIEAMTSKENILLNQQIALLQEQNQLLKKLIEKE